MILLKFPSGVKGGSYCLMKASLCTSDFVLLLMMTQLFTKSMTWQSIVNCTMGIYYSHNLTWTEHYKHITAKVYNTLGLLRRTFKTNNTQVKKQLYISLVRSQLLYCSQLWRPQLIRDIQNLEHIQRRATKYILNNYDLSYRQCLEQLNLLPLMYTYELNDLIFFIKTSQSPSAHFDISEYIQFGSHNTRSASTHKLSHHRITSSSSSSSYFNGIIHLWNSMRVIDLTLSLDTIKST